MAEVTASAPGRVNLIGEHTDYHEGFVMPCAIPQRTQVSLRVRGDGRVVARSAERPGETVEYTLGSEQKCGDWGDYVQGVTHVLRGAGWRYSLVLLCLIVPVAILANMIRIMLLVLLTWHAGDAVTQGFLHNSAGFLMFVLALGMIIALDALLMRWVAWRWAA